MLHKKQSKQVILQMKGSNKSFGTQFINTFETTHHSTDKVEVLAEKSDPDWDSLNQTLAYRI